MNNEYIKVFKAFTDESRVRVLEILCEGEECACVLLDDLQISQPTLSHHMKILCDSGIVKSRRVGKWNYYSINEEGCQYASELLSKVMDKKMDLIDKAVIFYRKTRFIRHPFTVYDENDRPAGRCCCCGKLRGSQR
ncbi:MAG: winged helix-turn-helix transcriptional regulator [Firmicutes bacterium]|nr:winged helix-turn-helix transcriptional regulator [Bacillota bacterium]